MDVKGPYKIWSLSDDGKFIPPLPDKAAEDCDVSKPAVLSPVPAHAPVDSTPLGVGSPIPTVSGPPAQPSAPVPTLGDRAKPKALNVYPDPYNEKSVEIYFGIVSGVAPTKDQLTLQSDLAKVLNVVRRLYPPLSPHEDIKRRTSEERLQASKFRRYYRRLFLLAQLGLEAPDAPVDIARAGLDALSADLVDDEGTRVKNGHLAALGRAGLVLGSPFLLTYFVTGWLRPAWLDSYLHVDLVRTTSYMLLWLGCFLGVWLSYGIRTGNITVADLAGNESDRLLPHMRLLFAGSLTMLLGMLFDLKIVDVAIGPISASSIASNARLAFALGAFCGISELTLPASLASKAAAFITKLK